MLFITLPNFITLHRIVSVKMHLKHEKIHVTKKKKKERREMCVCIFGFKGASTSQVIGARRREVKGALNINDKLFNLFEHAYNSIRVAKV